MNMKFGFKVSGILIIFALLLASTPTSVVHSQMGGGYICGQFQRLDAGTRGFPSFVPFGSENNPSAWWIIGTLNQMVPVTSTGEEIPPNYGQHLRIWNPEFDSYSDSNQYLIGIGSYEYVNSCDPVIQFYADNETILSGECTVIHWSADASGLDSADLNGNAVNPGGGDLQVCPSENTSYTLRVNTSGGEFSQALSVNVIQPTSTPIPLPTRTPVPPTLTPIPPSATPIPPTQPSATTVPTSLLPPDGPRSPSGFWCFLPGFCVQAAVNTTCHPQCVETANRLRSDLPIWGAVMTSDQILAVAESEPVFKFQNEMQQVRVRGINEAPQSGDLVIWPHDCDYAWSGGGHIGYVTNGDPFSITDSNWDSACGERTNKPIDIKSCMRFITSPYQITPSNGILTPTPITPPNPVIVPTPSGQPTNPFQWIIDLFK